MGSENPNEKIERELRVSRILWLILSFCFPIYMCYIYSASVLRGNAMLFLSGFSKIPWTDPFVMILLCLALFECFLTVFLFRFITNLFKLKKISFSKLCRIRIIITIAILDSVAMYGLVIGVTHGAKMASLSFCLMLIPVIGGILITPKEKEFRDAELNN